MKYYDLIVVGGGAAGFFTAINAAELNRNLTIAILERGKEGLNKVKVSGGGRCNVTHAEFIPAELAVNYPRGDKELLGPFHSFMTGDTIQWFEDRGVELKIEDDGRMFPITDSSQTIIDCFLNEIEKHGVDVLYNHSLKHFYKTQDTWVLETVNGPINCANLVITTGSNPKIWNLLKDLGHKIIDPVPSLFTFNIVDQRIKDIPGVTIDNVAVKIKLKNSGKAQLTSDGPLLITHWGLSAPSILKLSAFGAIELAACDYKFEIEINFINQSTSDCLDSLKDKKLQYAKKNLFNNPQYGLPKRFWNNLIDASGISRDSTWADINKDDIIALSNQLTQAVFSVDGKSTFKEEFVTAGGVDLKEIDFKRFESKIHKNLFFAGEVLNIDAVTGGFNFQSAWTGGYLVARALTNNI